MYSDLRKGLFFSRGISGRDKLSQKRRDVGLQSVYNIAEKRGLDIITRGEESTTGSGSLRDASAVRYTRLRLQQYLTYINHHHEKLRMSRSGVEPCIPYNHKEVTPVGIVALQVDDGLIAGFDESLETEKAESGSFNSK